MQTIKQAFTQKYPFNYIVVFDDGISVSTTDEARHQRLLMLIEDNAITKFYDIEPARRMQIECSFNVVRPVTH